MEALANAYGDLDASPVEQQAPEIYVAYVTCQELAMDNTPLYKLDAYGRYTKLDVDCLAIFGDGAGRHFNVWRKSQYACVIGQWFPDAVGCHWCRGTYDDSFRVDPECEMSARQVDAAAKSMPRVCADITEPEIRRRRHAMLPVIVPLFRSEPSVNSPY